jgi:Bacteriophage probable baseplate hub protein
MDFVQLESRHNRFYAPTVQILVDNRDLLKHEGLEIASIQIDNTLDSADRFTFTINNIFNFTQREFIRLKGLFDFGRRVDIRMGYLTIDKLTLMHQGLITSVNASFPAGSMPQLTVSGYDLSYGMMQGKISHNWGKKKDSDIARELAGKHKLKANVQDSHVEHPKIEQNQQSDYQFLKTLAERNGYELYVFHDTLFFREPANDESGTLTLEWGKGLLSFSPEINIAEQVTNVEVRGWNVDRKQEIVGKARKGDEPGRDRGRKSGGEFNAEACKQDITLRVRLPVYSQQEADRQAKAILKKRSEGFVKGSGESIGIPEILADKNIALKGLGDMFSRTYYIEQSTHTINTSGYKTSFRVKDTTI